MRITNRTLSLAALALILVLAAALRLWDLAGVPPGLWFDEALNGQDAAAVWGWGVAEPTGFRLIYPDEFPREPLYETLLALVVRLGGPRVVVMRALSVAIGLLTILLLYFMLRAEFGEGPALCAAAVLATMRWHIIFSRLVFRTIVLGPWMIGVVWAALAYRRRPTLARAALFGALVGGGFYTYLAWYFMLPLVLGVTVWLFRLRLATREGRLQIALAAGCALIVALPLGAHYARAPRLLLSRPAAVSVFSEGFGPGLREIAENAGEALLMFHWRGDHVAKQNIPNAPALDLPQGLLLLYGLGVCAAHARRRHPLALILLGWIACGLLTTILTRTDSPNFLRSLCLTPAVATLTGWGLAHLVSCLSRACACARNRYFDNSIDYEHETDHEKKDPAAPASIPHPQSAFRTPAAHAPWIAIACVVLVVGYSGARAAWNIHHNWAPRQEVWREFNGDIAQLGREARDTPADTALFVPQYPFQHRTFQFHLLSRTGGAVLPYADWSFLAPGATPAGARERRVIVTANNGLFSALRRLVPGGGVIHEFRTPNGNVWAAIYSVPEASLPSAAAVADIARDWPHDLRF